MERTTKEIKTKSGHSIFIYTYITGREKRSITDVFLNSVEIKQVGGVQETSGMKASVANEAENQAIKVCVAEIVPNGSTVGITEKQNIVDFILDLDQLESSQIVKEINAITSPKSDETR